MSSDGEREKGAEKGGLDDGRHASVASRHIPVEQSEKSYWDRLWPVIACGAGLFSDGYLNAVRILWKLDFSAYLI
jgi:hypothetical protein